VERDTWPLPRGRCSLQGSRRPARRIGPHRKPIDERIECGRTNTIVRFPGSASPGSREGKWARRASKRRLDSVLRPVESRIRQAPRGIPFIRPGRSELFALAGIPTVRLPLGRPSISSGEDGRCRAELGSNRPSKLAISAPSPKKIQERSRRRKEETLVCWTRAFSKRRPPRPR